MAYSNTDNMYSASTSTLDPSNSNFIPWNQYTMDPQIPLQFSAPYLTPDPSTSSQLGYQAETTPQQPYVPAFQSPPTSISSQAYFPHPNLDPSAAASIYHSNNYMDPNPIAPPIIHSLPAPLERSGRDPTCRFPNSISDSSFSTPSDGDHQNPFGQTSSIPSAVEQQTSLDTSLLPVPNVVNTSRIDPVEGITERLGEFLFNPKEKSSSVAVIEGSGASHKRMKPKNGAHSFERRDSLVKISEQDGLSDAARTVL